MYSRSKKLRDAIIQGKSSQNNSASNTRNSTPNPARSRGSTKRNDTTAGRQPTTTVIDLDSDDSGLEILDTPPLAPVRNVPSSTAKNVTTSSAPTVRDAISATIDDDSERNSVRPRDMSQSSRAEQLILSATVSTVSASTSPALTNTKALSPGSTVRQPQSSPSEPFLPFFDLETMDMFPLQTTVQPQTLPITAARESQTPQSPQRSESLRQSSELMQAPGILSSGVSIPPGSPKHDLMLDNAAPSMISDAPQAATSSSHTVDAKTMLSAPDHMSPDVAIPPAHGPHSDAVSARSDATNVASDAGWQWTGEISMYSLIGESFDQSDDKDHITSGNASESLCETYSTTDADVTSTHLTDTDTRRDIRATQTTVPDALETVTAETATAAIGTSTPDVAENDQESGELTYQDSNTLPGPSPSVTEAMQMEAMQMEAGQMTLAKDSSTALVDTLITEIYEDDNHVDNNNNPHLSHNPIYPPSTSASPSPPSLPLLLPHATLTAIAPVLPAPPRDPALEIAEIGGPSAIKFALQLPAHATHAQRVTSR